MSSKNEIPISDNIQESIFTNTVIEKISPCQIPEKKPYGSAKVSGK
jgi:hypothetical protein